MKRGINIMMRKLYGIPISVSTNKVLLVHSHAHCLPIVYGCFCAMPAELSSCQRESMALKYLLSGSLQKKSANPCTEGSAPVRSIISMKIILGFVMVFYQQIRKCVQKQFLYVAFLPIELSFFLFPDILALYRQ